MSETPNLALPLLAAAQAQKHVTHNEALLALDALVQCAVLDRDLSEPPSDPAEGERFIVAGAGSGAWAGKGGQIAAWQGRAWNFYEPRAGLLAYVADEGQLYLHDGQNDGQNWTSALGALTALGSLARLGVGTEADASNPFSAKLNAALWTARSPGEGGTGNLRYTLNKSGSGSVLSFLFQSAYSGRAEIGLVGDDDLRFKMSADGSTWTEALRISGTGTVGIGAAPGTERLTIGGNLAPALDNAFSIGTPTRRVSTVYAATGVINTSDIRAKIDVSPIGAELALTLLKAAEPIAFRFREAVARTSTGDRPESAEGEGHFGWSAQAWRDALDGAGTEAGLLVTLDPGLPDTELGLRPDQISALIHAALLGLAREVTELTDRLDRLEAQRS